MTRKMFIRNAEELRALAGATIFSVVFTKRTTGEVRKMRCRFRVAPKKKGGKGPAYDPTEKGLIVVFDVEKEGFRSIPLDAVTKFTIRGRVYESGAQGT